ncbi:MAG: hypothetical protein WBX22_26170 [Silvibacterium sp.]
MRMAMPGNICACDCHAHQVKVHLHPCCECGKPITPPKQKDCGPQKTPKCSPPKIKPQPGTVDVPQTPPPVIKTSKVPPWKEGKPTPGDSGEIPWFAGKIKDTLRNGPTFGPRKDEYLPFLAIRACSGDRGGRPLPGVFWESPDIFVAPNLDAGAAPLMPPTLGGVAQANAPNTLYAHVWNFGKAPAHRVRVEFYWFNPSLGIARADANLVSAAWVDLGNRFTLFPKWTQIDKPYGEWMSQGCHAIVRCPETWIPTFENNGHECLVVRIFEPIFDALDPQQFSAAADRHVAQRNIAVVQAASPASIDLGLNLGTPSAPADAEVDLSLDLPANMEWLQLYAGKKDTGFVPATGGVSAGFLPPMADGSHIPPFSKIPSPLFTTLLKQRERFSQGCCPLKVSFHAIADDLAPHQAQVLRIRQRIGGEVVGGYTVVLIKP